jgi:hypothetical protein
MVVDDAANTPTSKVIRPIRISDNGRYFVDKAGSPFFWLGDTQWELFRLFDIETARHILSDRRDKGFNVILIMLTGVERGRIDPSLADGCANIKGEVPWLNGDPLRPNEAYFRHVDKMIRLGEETVQIFVVGIYHQWHVDRITLEKARPWARWVARRYRDVPNLIWSMYPQATEAFVPVCRELAAGLREGDGGAHLISVHPDPSVASSSFLHEEPWLAFNMIQTCVSYDRIHGAVSADYARRPVKPVVMAEGGYEGLEFDQLQTPHDIRKQAYWTYLAGGHHVYGHNDAWASPTSWQDWLRGPGAAQLRVFRDVITSLDNWWDLTPDQSILLDGAKEGYALNAAGRSISGGWTLIYLSEASDVTLRPRTTALGNRVRLTWIDPRTGNRTHGRELSAADSLRVSPPAGWPDALLCVEGLSAS